MPSRITVKELLEYPFDKLSRRIQERLSVYEIGAEDFLGFAREDSKGQDLRSWVNALGNVKRAIECRIDSLLYDYCLHKKSEKEKWNFPRKIEIIKNLGIVAPSILKKINKKRNELEHEYIKPVEGDVNDAIDIAELFLRATSESAIMKYEATNEFAIELKREEGFVKLVDYRNDIEKVVKIDDDDGWIEFASRLSSLLNPSMMRFYRRSEGS